MGYLPLAYKISKSLYMQIEYIEYTGGKGVGGWITLVCMQISKGKYLPNPPVCDLPNPLLPEKCAC